jgi:hypothetical protein
MKRYEFAINIDKDIFVHKEKCMCLHDRKITKKIPDAKLESLLYPLFDRVESV